VLFLGGKTRQERIFDRGVKRVMPIHKEVMSTKGGGRDVQKRKREQETRAPSRKKKGRYKNRSDHQENVEKRGKFKSAPGTQRAGSVAGCALNAEKVTEKGREESFEKGGSYRKDSTEDGLKAILERGSANEGPPPAEGKKA